GLCARRRYPRDRLGAPHGWLADGGLADLTRRHRQRRARGGGADLALRPSPRDCRARRLGRAHWYLRGRRRAPASAWTRRPLVGRYRRYLVHLPGAAGPGSAWGRFEPYRILASRVRDRIRDCDFAGGSAVRFGPPGLRAGLHPLRTPGSNRSRTDVVVAWAEPRPSEPRRQSAAIRAAP